jgi:gliding motility-associated-like protein
MRTIVRLQFYFPKWSASLLFFLFCNFPFFFSAQAQVAGTFTINSAQPTGGTNFQTFNQAINALAGGISGPVTFNVAPGSGPYNERILLNRTIKTTATNTLRFNCNGVTLTFLSKENDQRAGVMLDSVDYVTFDSLVVMPQGQNDDEYGYGFHLLRDADHNTIQKCKIINFHNMFNPQRNDNIIINGNNKFGIDEGVSSCDSNIITRNVISGGFAGVTLSSVPVTGQISTMMKGNQITYNTITDVDNTAILLNGNADGALVEGNDITAPNAIWATGIILFNTNENCMIRNNRIHDLKNMYGLPVTGIHVATNASAGRENIVANNLIYDFASDGEINGIVVRDGYPASHVKIWHNTILLNENSPSAYLNTYGIAIGYNSTNVQVMNNIISITRTTTGANYGIFLQNKIPGFVSDRNNYHVVSPTAAENAIGVMDGTLANTLSDWQAITSSEMHSTAFDPLFTDPSTGNLVPGQAAIDNRGSFVNINTDITGAVRSSSAPDMGAYEFAGPPCTSPVAGSTMALPAATMCEDHPVTLTLSGNSFGTGQTYQWQSDTDINGSFSNSIGGAQSASAFDIHPTATLYYRAAVTCGATTVYSTPIQIVVDPALSAGTYTIDPAKPTGGSNFQSFSDAISAMQCGIRGHVVLDVVPGTYNQQLMIPAIYGTSPSKTVTFKGHGATFNYTSTNSDERAVIKLNGADYITLDSFNINISGTAANEYGFGLQLINDADHNTIQGCTIKLNKTSTSVNFAGIVISPVADNATYMFEANNCDSNTITGNTIIGGYYGITCTSNENTAFTLGNIITNNKILDNHAYGIYIAATKNLLIEENEISRPTRTVSFTSYVAVNANTRNMGLVVSKNRIHGLSDANKTASTQFVGIFLNNSITTIADSNVVSNNLLYDFGGAGLQHGMYYYNSDNTKFYHNTVSLEDSTISSTQATRGFAIYGTTTNGMVFKNNNITIKRAGTGVKHCIYITPVATTYTCDNNNFFISAGSTNYIGHVGNNSGPNYTTLINWRTGTGKDMNSISVDPAYRDPVHADFTPTVTVFENKGVYAGINTDINNRNRSITQPDIGAFEFFMCTVFPVVQVMKDSQTVCTGSPVTFDVKSPEANATYTWYNSVVNGTQIHTGTSYTINQLNNPVEYWIEAVSNEGCPSNIRKRVKAVNLAPLTQAPVVTIDSLTTNSIRFAWNAVPGAIAYQVSRDGVQFMLPTSGPGGLTHTIKGLNASDTASIIVKAMAIIDCQHTVSARVSARSLSNQYYIPNTFTPNGNGQNDVFKVYSNIMKSMHLMIFNQWGEKVFETTHPQTGWDGTYKGKQQPAGVYIYVARVLLTDGTTANQKGTVNLIR